MVSAVVRVVGAMSGVAPASVVAAVCASRAVMEEVSASRCVDVLVSADEGGGGGGSGCASDAGEGEGEREGDGDGGRLSVSGVKSVSAGGSEVAGRTCSAWKGR